MTNQNQLIVKSVLDAWYSKAKEAESLFDKLTDEQLQKEVAPNRNRGIYLLGHLTAVHDKMLPLLNLGEQLYPQLNDTFLSKPDKAIIALPSAKDLRLYSKNVNMALGKHFN